MTKDNEPAAASGGPRTASDTDQLASELPAKIRVHALAKQLGLTSKDVLAALADVGSPAKGAQSSIDRETALRVVAALMPDPSEPGGDTAEEIEDGALAAPLAPVFAAPQPLFMAPGTAAPSRPAADRGAAPPSKPERGPAPAVIVDDEDDDDDEDGIDDGSDEGAAGRRRRRRGRRGRGRGKVGGNGDDGDDDEASDTDESGQSDEDTDDEDSDEAADDADGEDDATGSRRRRRRRRRKAADTDANGEPLREDDPPNTVVHVRDSRPPRGATTDGDDGVQGVRGSTRLEAKRQRRRDGREAGRRRPPILSEAEFLARRESVDRVMVVREHGKAGGNGSGNGTAGLVQIGVLEDGVLSEHFVTSAGTGSLVGNVYLGRVQNVLPSMEAAFVDIGRGRNAVLYAGEVDWDAAGLEGKSRKIEQALSSGDSVLVQVTKDPVGHKGARLTTQISLPGRFLVYVPGGGATGISRKLPDTERKRLKDILRRIVPDDAGVIIRTASEGVTEEAMARDVRRLQAQWEVIRNRSEAPNAQAPQLLYEEPDLLIKVVRDLFTEDFSALVVQGRDAMDTIEAYVEHVAPDLASRLRRHVGNTDVFAEYRIDEQLLKALDRKVWLPSGGYLVIDRTEAMTVIDVNTGKFTGSGGNLEETVTRNNLEAAEEIVRQLRLRDIGGIIVIDFIDMVLESNRDLVLRRLTECLGRDRTRHQVAEVTSLGLVQMTRKRVGSGLLEAFSTPCEHCRGRGVVVSTEPVEVRPAAGGGDGRSSDRGGDGRGDSGGRRSRSRGKVTPEPADEPPVTKPAADKAADTRAADTRAAEIKAVADKGAADKGAVTRTAADKGAGGKRSADKAARTKAAAQPVADDAPVPAAAQEQDAHAIQPADTADAVSNGVPADQPEPVAASQPRSRRRSRSSQPAADAAAPAPDVTPATPAATTAAPDRTGATDAAAASASAHAAAPDRNGVSGRSGAPDGSGASDGTGTSDGAGVPDGTGGPDGAGASDGAVQPAAVTASGRPRRRRAASRPAGPPAGGDVSQAG